MRRPILFLLLLRHKLKMEVRIYERGGEYIGIGPSDSAKACFFGFDRCFSETYFTNLCHGHQVDQLPWVHKE
jgi:hypothetical protein